MSLYTVKDRFLFSALLFVLLHTFGSCTSENDTSNRAYFTFGPDEKKVVIPVQLNDSVNVKLGFDTGSPRGYYYMCITLDSIILAAHPSLTSDSIPVATGTGSAWNKNSGYLTWLYNSNPKLEIGNTDLAYSGMAIMNWKKYMSNICDGLFNIPKNDTTHIWELNFENNYMELHPAEGFVMPEDCFVTPLVGQSYFPFYIDLPLHVRFAGGDSLTISRRFVIDTGASWDIVLQHRAPELEYLNTREDAVWVKFLNSYIRHYTVNATLFDDYGLDSLRLYTIDYKNNINSADYLIGLNFLKRFNVFFDMKDKQLGLQPLKNFHRLVNPLVERYHFSVQRTPEGRFIVKTMGDYKENYYKTAGLQAGDEITAMNGVPYKDVTREVMDEFKKQDTVILDIIRNGVPQSLIVKIDTDEPVGD